MVQKGLDITYGDEGPCKSCCMNEAPWLLTKVGRALGDIFELAIEVEDLWMRTSHIDLSLAKISS